MSLGVNFEVSKAHSPDLASPLFLPLLLDQDTGFSAVFAPHVFAS